ncbi:MAG: LPS assembly lipoprotein LptE [Pseudomonadota bacterium]
MSLYSRRFVLALPVVVAGCGFTPVYGPGGAAEGLRGRVDVDPPRDTVGFELVRQLEDRFGLPDQVDYRLTADVFVSEEELGITPDQEITRFNVLGRVRFALFDLTSGDLVTDGEVSNFTSYSATGTPFATQTARQDARDRLMGVLADQIVARLLVTAEDWRG